MSCLYHIRYYTSHFVTFFSAYREGRGQQAKGRRQESGVSIQESVFRSQYSGVSIQESGDRRLFYLFSPHPTSLITAY
ncbi:MAG: hypothetical protein EWV89_02070 [Microcystis wesenbergii Mw_QC_B_20070930_S4]|nr:MAG: hypothetical protein EWV73_01535 [Microcystis wesenbergii Mw_QC_B_20070930_S4D]TRV17554.1 MAG: hypothetical protein EWV89_02070 [Microcystis wesenbergii Mw_QC_B_20070930_S4]